MKVKDNKYLWDIVLLMFILSTYPDLLHPSLGRCLILSNLPDLAQILYPGLQSALAS